MAASLKAKRDATPADAQALVAIEREKRQAKNDEQRRETLYTREEMVEAIQGTAEAFTEAIDALAGEYAIDILRHFSTRYAADVREKYPHAAMEVEDHYRGHATKILDRVREAGHSADQKGANNVERPRGTADRAAEPGTAAGPNEAQPTVAAEVLQIHNPRPVAEHAI
jgi:hypothetical protein